MKQRALIAGILLIAGIAFPGCKEKMSQRIPPEGEKKLFEANQAFNEKKFDSALEITDEMIRKFPDYLPSYLLRGKIFFFTKKNKEADEIFSKILAREPGHQGALLWLARIANQDKKTAPAAEQYLLRGLNNNPEDLSFQIEIAEHYAKTGNLRQAMAAYQKTMAMEFEILQLYRSYEALLRQHKLADRADRIRARRAGLETLLSK